MLARMIMERKPMKEKSKHLPIRIGMIGSNFVSDWAAQAIACSQCCTLSAIYSREQTHGEAFAAKHGIPHVYSDFATFLSSTYIDAVYIASPNALHYEQATAALRAGKHVLCEKPLTLNAHQADALLQLAQCRNLVLMEEIRPLHDPFLQIVRENLPRIGRIRRATFEFCQYSSRYNRFLQGAHTNAFDPSLGNAAVLDLGVYCFHCCVALFGSPIQVFARSSRLANGMEAAGTVLLDYADKQCTVIYSKVTQSVFPSYIQGECGSITFDTLSHVSQICYADCFGGRQEIAYIPEKNNMCHVFNAFCSCINGADCFQPYMAQSIAVLRVIDSVRKQNGISFGDKELV